MTVGEGAGSRAQWQAWLALSAVWLAIALCIGIEGDFPLNDDFAYHYTTDLFLRTGVFERTEWTWTPIISNVAIGVLFSKVFGYSMETMRLSGVVMGWVAAFGAYALGRQFKLSPLLSTVVAGSVICNPMFVNLSFTYMLDVPFTAFIVWSLYFLARGIEHAGDRTLPLGQSFQVSGLVLGAALAAAALLSRQTGLAVALGFVATAAMVRFTARSAFYLGATLCAFMLLYWMAPLVFGEHDGRKQVTLGIVEHYLKHPHLVYFFSRYLFTSAAIIGIMLVPTFFAALPHGLAIARWPLGVGALAAVASPFVFLKLGIPLPLGGNIMGNFYVGAQTTHPFSPDRMSLHPLPPWFWHGLVAIGIFVVVVSAVWMVLRFRRLLRPAPLLTLSFTAIYLFPHVIREAFFDRYLLPLFPVLSATVLGVIATRGGQDDPQSASDPIINRNLLTYRLSWASAALTAAPLLFWATAGTHDYLERSRAAWALIRKQEARGVHPLEFNGGVEYRGMRRFDYPELGDRLPIVDYYYDEPVVLSLTDRLADYEVIDRASYTRWLPPMGTRHVSILQKPGFKPGTLK